MARHTSIEAFNTIKENGLLSKRRLEVYSALFKHGPCTANELGVQLRKMFAENVNLNVVTRLGELRNVGVVSEIRERACSITGMTVIEWDVTSKLPMKFDKHKKQRCPYCKGTGVLKSTQGRLF